MLEFHYSKGLVKYVCMYTEKILSEIYSKKAWLQFTHINLL